MHVVSFHILQLAVVSSHYILRQIAASPKKPLVIKPELLYSNDYSIASVSRWPGASFLLLTSAYDFPC
jgi:hypothetical protein